MKQKTFYWVDPVSHPKYQPARLQCCWDKFENAKKLMSELLAQRYPHRSAKYFYDHCVSITIDCPEFENSTNAIACLADSGQHPFGLDSWNPVQREDVNIDEYLYFTREGLPAIAGIYCYNNKEENQFVLLVDNNQ